ncbi:MAG: dienelactone hydrolase family protein [Bacteriovoracaceae bacterium]|nr:dienelactone hydrolase family protein [Bacteriovoracaceae bacterium]
MKKLILFPILTLILFSCSHMEKKTAPMISFTEGDATYSAELKLPKKFKEPVPLVVIVHEWWGRTSFMSEQSEKITKEGYATLAVDLYGNSKVVESPQEAQELATPFYKNPEMGISLLKKYIELAKNDPHIDKSKIYVIGFCFGGTQALNLARTGYDFQGVVSFHGGLASSLPQKAIKARILALNGLADPFVPAKEREAFEKEMKTVKADYKVVNYKDSTHAFTNPHSTAVGLKFKIPVAYNQEAAEASFKEFLAFIQK